MALPQVQIDMRSLPEGIKILDIQGEITESAEEALFAARSAASSGVRAIILNLSKAC